MLTDKHTLELTEKETAIFNNVYAIGAQMMNYNVMKAVTVVMETKIMIQTHFTDEEVQEVAQKIRAFTQKMSPETLDAIGVDRISAETTS